MDWDQLPADCTWPWHHHPASNPTEHGKRAFQWCWAGACLCKDHHPWAAEWDPKFSPHPARLHRTWIQGSLPAALIHAGCSDGTRISSFSCMQNQDNTLFFSEARPAPSLLCFTSLPQRRIGLVPAERHTPSSAPR